MMGALTSDAGFVGHQLPGLLRRYRYVFLVVEGRTKPDPKSGVLLVGHEWEKKAWDGQRGLSITAWSAGGHSFTRHLWDNALKFRLTLALKAKLIVLTTQDKTETAYLVRGVYGWFQKRWAAHQSVYRVDETKPDATIFEERSVKRRVFNQLPGVDWVRSKQAAQYFPTVAAGVTASVDEWQRALGIKKGRAVATRIVAACSMSTPSIPTRPGGSVTTPSRGSTGTIARSSGPRSMRSTRSRAGNRRST
jgi:hypothetical protein